MRVLLTGAAGFIGFHLAKRLLSLSNEVVGVDNMNDYYDVSIKYNRLEILKGYNGFQFHNIDIKNTDEVFDIFKSNKFDVVVNLAAQAGVRYSLEDPMQYIDSNIVGFLNILEACRHNNIGHLVYASSSSVYGGNSQIPFSEKHRVDKPLSMYAVTKRSNELMSYSYSELFGIPTTGLRFFTVYGPWGRPDMALFKFTKSILEGKPIQVYNNGEHKRDFTYVDDIVDAICILMSNPPKQDSSIPWQVLNIGNSNPVSLMEFIGAIESELGIQAVKEFLPLQAGDVPNTAADISMLSKLSNFSPKVAVADGIKYFISWYLDYYGLSIKARGQTS